MHVLYKYIIPSIICFALVIIVYLSVKLNKLKQYKYEILSIIKNIKRYCQQLRDNQQSQSQQNNSSMKQQQGKIQSFDLRQQRQLNQMLSNCQNYLRNINKQTSIRQQSQGGSYGQLRRRNSIDYFIQMNDDTNTIHINENDNKQIQQDNIKQSSSISGSHVSIQSAQRQSAEQLVIININGNKQHQTSFQYKSKSKSNKYQKKQIETSLKQFNSSRNSLLAVCKNDHDTINLYRNQLANSKNQLISINNIHPSSSSNKQIFSSNSQLYHANGIKTFRDLIQEGM